MSVPTGVISLAGWGPFPATLYTRRRAALFLMLNINKRGVTLDLKTSVGKRMLTELVRQTDVLVESFSPRVMSSLGLSYESLAEANPDWLWCPYPTLGRRGLTATSRRARWCCTAWAERCILGGCPEGSRSSTAPMLCSTRPVS